jgi:Holliday junction resolvase RusA-like endonuclease
MIFFLPKPKSAKKAEVFCSKKPDLDNLEKCIMDCMEGLILTNDSRVVEKSAGKRYAIDRGPGVEVVIAPVLREEGQV